MSSFEERLEKKGIDIRECMKKDILVDGRDNLKSINEMSSDHLVNCIDFLENNGYKEKNGKFIKLPIILEELKDDYLEIFNNKLNELEQEYDNYINKEDDIIKSNDIDNTFK